MGPPVLAGYLADGGTTPRASPAKSSRALSERKLPKRVIRLNRCSHVGVDSGHFKQLTGRRLTVPALRMSRAECYEQENGLG